MAFMLCARAAWAAPQTLTITPDNTEIGFRVYVFGFIPLDGHFTRFSGTLTLDPADPGQCRIAVRVVTASLVMPDAKAERMALGEDFLNASAYPALLYDGGCRAQPGGPPRLDGQLGMRGLTGALAFSLARTGQRFEVEATLQRDQWGMTAHPMLAGGRVRIRVTTALAPP